MSSSPGSLAKATLTSMSASPGGTWKKYVLVSASAPARPFPPVSTPLKVPPPGPSATVERRVTGTVVVAPTDEKTGSTGAGPKWRKRAKALLAITSERLVSPGLEGVVRLSATLVVAPGASTTKDGLTVP